MQLSGQQAEQLARQYLEQRGLVCIKQNYRCRQGEIDLIMQQQSTLVFVEVRYRRSRQFGSPLASITRHKQQRIIVSARHFIRMHPAFGMAPTRFDCIGISANQHITWIPHAFEIDYADF